MAHVTWPWQVKRLRARHQAEVDRLELAIVNLQENLVIVASLHKDAMRKLMNTPLR